MVMHVARDNWRDIFTRLKVDCEARRITMPTVAFKIPPRPITGRWNRFSSLVKWLLGFLPLLPVFQEAFVDVVSTRGYYKTVAEAEAKADQAVKAAAEAEAAVLAAAESGEVADAEGANGGDKGKKGKGKGRGRGKAKAKAKAEAPAAKAEAKASARGVLMYSNVL